MNTDTSKVARKFAEVLRSWLSPEEIAQVIALNKAEPSDNAVCHSHDYCDANMAMIEALELEALDFGGLETNPPEYDAAIELWNEAWTLAKNADFNPEVL